ncbi:MAG: ATP phosphoribosyltransferase [Alphaproteobacteria bacterium]|nr:ATP phosphoribosyltransferase [Alphaproteobacteria bacterium]MBU1516998.1 ATP phosphoribosyltransferase [Alphaproteobacteria bacterium]MBU2093578.1 ATP phosphoribosyltransferase [Alphaproteobacteria bacterium]MBU2152860.1 ATP phosphoribosyltransferase [Alphaproteobacteria bacterium]MBU2305566.1 ATP phosphoribosyltransferase [Alphaproteobacteria bacterium]
MSGLIIAVPSKGRLKEQVEGWLGDCGLKLEVTGGARGYMASLKGVAGAQVRLLSAADIADALDAGEVHLGVTGEDLLRERGEDLDSRVLLLRALGFGRADLVTAVPKSWLDVESMADLEEVAHDYLRRTGRRMRVATKYLTQTRGFFARHGIADYRIAESGGATEGAPAAGSAEIVIDITSTGATLQANGLKVLADGVMLRSQAQLAASLRAAWDSDALAQAERLLRIVEARAAALRSATLAWPARGDAVEVAVVNSLVSAGATRRPNGLLVDSAKVSDASLALTAAGLGPVTASKPDFVFDVSCAPLDTLKTRVF